MCGDETIWSEEWWIVGIFAFESDKSTQWNSIECVLCAWFVLSEFFEFWWYAYTKFEDFHAAEFSCSKVSEFMDDYQEHKYRYTDDDAEHIIY